jgi:beta-lactamase superfamily II metal-dependent hydrolase
MKKLLLAFSVLLILYLPAVAETNVHFVDVGQGDCTIVQSAGKTLVIDTGPPDARAALEDHLKAYGIDRIDVLVLTHPHEDHDGSLGYLIDGYPIGTLLMPEYTDDEDDYGGLLRRITGNGTQIRYPSVGDQFTVGDATITILSATNPAQYPDDRNLWSIVLKIEDGGTAALIMGDAEDINEYAMIDTGIDVGADILRVGHHGSHTSTSDAFLGAVTPDVAIISCGAGNPYGHPHQEVLDALYDRQITVLRTYLNGTITATIGTDTYTITKEK